MSDLIPFERGDDRSYNEQINDALRTALEIHGTILNDLNQAMNAILQMERAMRSCGVPNPYEAIVHDLKVKYNMGFRDETKFHREATLLLEQGDEGLPEGEVVQGELVEGDSDE